MKKYIYDSPEFPLDPMRNRVGHIYPIGSGEYVFEALNEEGLEDLDAPTIVVYENEIEEVG